MIEIGTVKEKKDGGMIVVEFGHLQTEAECSVLQATTGENNVFALPSVGTQVVCWIEPGKNIALGAIFSETEKVPEAADPNGEFRQYGDVTFEMKNTTARLKQGEAVLEFESGKAVLKNDKAGLKDILNDFLKAVKTLTVATSLGPSGAPLPPTIQAVTKLEQQVANLFK